YGIVLKVYVADTDAEALRVAREALPRFKDSFAFLWERHGDFKFTERLGDFDECIERGVLFAGSPTTVSERLTAFLEGTGGNYFGACFAWGGLSHEQVMRSMALFTEKVIPYCSSPTAVGEARPALSKAEG